MVSPYPVGLCCPGRAAPGARSRRWSPSATRRTGNQWHSPGLGPGLCTRTPRSARRPLCTPYHFSRAEACPRVRERDNKTVDGRVKEHESILRIAGARRATAAARRRTTGASSAAARASSVVTLDARRPRSGTPRRHPLRAAPSGRGPHPDHAREAPHDRWTRRGRLVPIQGPRPHDADRGRRLGGRPSYNSSLRSLRDLERWRRRQVRGARRVQELEHAVDALIGHFLVVARTRRTNTAALVARPGSR